MISASCTDDLEQWIEDGVVFKFWGDNLDKLQRVHDLRSDHVGEMLYTHVQHDRRSKPYSRT